MDKLLVSGVGRKCGFPMNESATSLELLGWSRQGIAYPQLTDTQGVSRVVVEHRGAYEILGPFGAHEAILETASRQIADDPTDYPAVGDWVVHSLEPIDNRRVGIIEVLPRRSRVLRRAPGSAPVPQVVGANIDVLALVVSVDQEIDEHLIERYLVTAEGGNASPIIVVNKSDLGGAGKVRDRLEQRGIRCPIYLVSAKNEDPHDQLVELLNQGSTVAVTGSSGVGKSTLVNQMVGDVVLATGAVTSEGSGRHTTVRRELLLAQGGVLIDTPGLREVQIWEELGLETVFHEIAAVATACRFADCSHRNEPSCAVKQATVDGRIDSSRLASYLALCEELSNLTDEIDEYQRSQRRRRDARQN